MNGQLKITDANTQPYTPENLIRNVFLGSGVEVTSINYKGDSRSVGYFSSGMEEINLERGIVLSTGQVSTTTNKNETLNDSGDQMSNSNDQDPDLEAIANEVVNDVALYTISFIPSSDTLRFNYVFASEEYPEFICDKNDVFGFFVTGPNPDGGNYDAKNIALIPELSDPTGLTFTDMPVSINTVHGQGSSNCPAAFEEYYNEVPIGTEHFQHNAYLDVFTAEVVVIPCEEYTIKLGVADAVDKLLNSVVFLEAKSFGTGTLAVSLNSLSVDGSLAEGCGSGELEFVLPETVKEDYIIDIDFFTEPNSATPDVDYPAIPDQLIIPAGSKSVSVPLEAYLDGTSEGDEVIVFEIQVDLCNRKRFEIMIRDDDLFAPILPDDVTICSGDSYLIESELDPGFTLPPSPYFENLTKIDIDPELEPVYSDIQVSGVIPTILTANSIERVCIKGIEHRDLTDLDIYLISPGGQFLELSTDNGFKANNFADVDSFKNTCFTPDAITEINNGQNLVGPIFSSNERYTGDFKPEGEWADLWDGDNPTNGTWRLLVLDDFEGATGILDGWSITFKSFYDLTYEWTANPSTTLCGSCEDITVEPEEDTEFTLKIIDSYGCEREESMMIFVAQNLDEPIISCNQVSQNSIEVIWNDIANATGYEIRIDGGAWMQTSETDYTFTSLSSSTTFDIEIMAVSEDCNSSIALVQCETDACAKPTVVVNIVNEVTCPGGNDGEVNLVATGSGPFNFEINGVSNTTGDFTNIPIGVNEYTVTDNTGCVRSEEFTMTGPDEFFLNGGYKLSQACNVVSEITGSFNVSGGTPPYTYLWSNLTTDQVAVDLSPGTYFVTVTDDNNCEAFGTLDIPMLEQFLYDVDVTAPLCKDGNNGKAEINIVSGNGPFTYLWEDGTTESSNENLSEGFYVVTVTDALGCEIPKPFTIDEGAVLTLDISPEDISCLGMTDGRATATVTGGEGPYTYIWDGVSSSNSTVDGLTKGEHTLMVTDGNNCSETSTFNIEEPLGMVYSIVQVDNICYDGSAGEIEINGVSSPNGDVTILWDDGSTSFTRMGLPNSTYCFILNDGTSCELDSCIQIGSPDEILIEEKIFGPTCLGSTDAKIELVISGGTIPYSFSWNGPDGMMSSDANIENLSSGEYFVTITDGNACNKVASFTVQPAKKIEVDFTVFPISCFGESKGQIFFAASGGRPPFTYNWTGPNGFTANTNNIMGVPAGNYFVTYTDLAGCSETFDFFIEQPSQALSANISIPDTICFGTTNGKLSVAPSGGTAPYTIEWSNGFTQANNVSLAKGVYNVTVTDSRSCTIIASSSVSELENISVNLSDTPSLCFQTNDGSAQVIEAFYGSNSADISNFTYKWNTNPVQTTTQAFNLVGGNSYSVILTDKFGCTGQEVIEISTPESVDARLVNISNVSCFGEQDGVLEIEGVGGSGNFSYQWDGQVDFSTSSIIDGLTSSNYQVTITDSNGCTGFSSFAIEEPRPLNMDFRVIDVSCYGGSDGRAESVVQGGTGPYTFMWTNEASGKAIENVVSEQYNVTVTDANGCTLTDSTRVNEPDEPIRVELTFEDVNCNNGNNGKIEIQAEGGSGFYRYSIDGEAFQSTNVFTSLEAGNYTVYVSDFKGCVDTFPETIITEPDPIIVILGPDLVIPFGENVQIMPEVYNHIGQLDALWKSANIDLLSCNTCINPIFTGEREASFEFAVTDENGCSGNDFITIRLENYSPFFVPTAFTPNGDGENDELKVFSAGVQEINSFQIYNRWGELVYTAEAEGESISDVSWDGVYKGEILPSGLYYWFAEVTYQNGFNDTLEGNTTLMK
nr:choice-of-anchor L domain-containing protein [Portibacter lacus]